MFKRPFRRWWLLAAGAVLLVGACVPVDAQGTLSQQVLALLSRTNSWIGQNTFYNFRIPIGAIPGDTAARLYTDPDANLYYNGGLIAGSGGGVTPHNLLSTTHPDTVPAAPQEGSVIVGNSTPKWARLTPSVTGSVLQFNGTDTVFSTSGAQLTALPAANLTGIIAAISGENLTNLNADGLASGTVPLARLVDITDTEISASANIQYSKLSLSGSIVNADVSGGAAIAYAKLNLANSVTNADIVAAAGISLNKLAQTAATVGQVIAWSGTAWVPATVSGGGSVSSVGLAMPAIFGVTGSPVIGSGTLTVALNTQVANTIFAGPTTGADTTPAFRALVAADIPNLSAAKLTTGVANLPSAAAGAPAYAFSTEPTLGLYRYGAGILGVTGAIYPDTNAAYDLGLTTQRWRNFYLSANALVNTLRLGWNGSADANTLLSVDPGTYPALLEVSTGSGGARGDIWASRLALGSAGNPTFATTYYSKLNLIDTWTAALTAQPLAGLNVQQTVNQTGAATQTAYSGRFTLGTTSASNQSGLTALLANATYGGSATAADVRSLTAQTTTTAGIITAQYGAYIDSNSSATVTNNYALYVGGVASVPTLTNQYGIYIANQTVAGTTLDYAIYYAAPSSRTFSVAATGDVVEGSFQATDVNVAAPAGSDCDAAGETGKYYYDSSADNLYICSGASGWRKVTTGAP